MATFKEALIFAQQNPDSQFSSEFRRRIEAGQLDKEAKQEGIDLSQFRTQSQPGGGGFINGTIDFLKGALKGGASTLLSVPKKVSQIFEIGAKKKLIDTSSRSISQLDESGKRIQDALNSLPKGDSRRTILEQALKSNISTQQEISGNLPQSLTSDTERVLSGFNPTNTAQEAGFTIEKIAEFFIPGKAVLATENTLLKGGEALSTAAKAGELTRAGNLLAKIARPLTRLGRAKDAGQLNTLGKITETGLRTLTRSIVEGGAGAITSAAQGQEYNQIKTSALVDAMFPVGGAVFEGAKGLLKTGVKKIGQGIETAVIKPLARDIEDGFKIENVSKYNVGGSLKDVVAKTHIKLNQLGLELKNKLKGSTETIDLNSIYSDTEKALQKDLSSNFGENGAIRRVLGGLKDEIGHVSSNGSVDLVQSNLIKRGAGTKGAWSFGNPDPDANATEKVYDKFYNILKTKIEQTAPEGIEEINKKISELIPISNAALRRLPIQQRKEILDFTDSLGLFASVFDPRALLLIGAKKLSRSGKFGNFLVKAGERTPSRGVLRQRIFGSP